MNLGPHAAFIWGSYGAVALGLGGLLAWLASDARTQRARLAQLEARGVRRRTSAPDTGLTTTAERATEQQTVTP